jgi:HK97 gp10 family phage protein
MRSSIEVENIAELKRDLSGIQEKLTKKDLVKVMRPGATVMRKAAQQRTPVRTGILRKAWRIKVGRGSAKAPQATLTTDLAKNYRTRKGKMSKPYYAWFVHNGTVVTPGKRKHRKRVDNDSQSRRQKIRPNPFVAEAFDANVDRVANMILDNINNML